MPEDSGGSAEKAGTSGSARRNQETRFAVVLNGGVSLAVWMGGVTHELNRLRVASARGDTQASVHEPPVSPKEAAVHDAWRAILDHVSREAVVDTVAGTSAGGLNGTLLAAAVAGGKDLSDMRDVWADVASLERGKLLSAAGAPANAVLDGDFFREKVTTLLADLKAAPEAVAPQDCTLLVTATALNADPVEIKLEGAASAHMVDSRRVYRFERRTRVTGDIVHGSEVTDDDFDEARPSIALASRASASFPVAFAPVQETRDLRRFRVHPSPGSAEGPEAEPTTGPDVPHDEWLIDGGVLDNAPFGPLMKALRARAVGEPFERVVLYVTPHPGTRGRAKDLGHPPKARRVLKRVLSALREPDLRLDYEELGNAFTQMGFTLSTPHDAVFRLFCEPVSGQLVDAIQATVAEAEWFETYRAARAEAIHRYLAALDGRIRFVKPVRSSTEVLDMISVPNDRTYSGQYWQWGLATAMRALRWWGRALVAYYDEPGVSTGTIEDALAQVQRSQRKLTQLQRALDLELRTHRLPDTMADRAALLDAALGPMEPQIREAVDAAAEAIAKIRPQQVSAGTLIDFTLAVEVASAVLSWGSGSEGDEPAFHYLQVTPDAKPLVELGDELADHPEWLERKLYGERLGHFGAFLNREDRAADWLWGRLDGAGALCGWFLKDIDADEAQPLKDALADAILAAEGSSVPALKAAAAEAMTISSLGLLRTVDPWFLPNTARFLWDKTKIVLRWRFGRDTGTTTSSAEPAPSAQSAAPRAI